MEKTQCYDWLKGFSTDGEDNSVTTGRKCSLLMEKTQCYDWAKGFPTDGEDTGHDWVKGSTTEGEDGEL